ncbi:hypothetical protein VNI00_000013 [Paramarasmius palmivorus]|uniref:F-box domain-containing protein n=1 Tax=Paramarasmius palmivorus TaxID=297713 RepID=A0AAW0ECI5_9AGAR
MAEPRIRRRRSSIPAHLIDNVIAKLMERLDEYDEHKGNILNESENMELPSYTPTVNRFLREKVYNYPEEHEVEDINKSITVANAYRHRLDREIFKAEVELARLNRMRDNAQHYIDDHKATISPFRRLPAEIITEVLKFSITIPPAPRRFFGRTGILFDIPDSLWTLSHVCAKWRSLISQAMPTQWTKLTISLPHIHKHSPSILSDCLPRSRNFPLSIKVITRDADGFTDDLYDTDDSDQTNKAVFIETVKLLVKECRRWKSFTLQDLLSPGGSSELDLAHDWPDLLKPVKGNTPLLEEVDLALKSFDCDAFLEAPLLALHLGDRAQLHQGFLTKFDFSRLTKLTICLPWLEMPSLTQLPKLVDLTLHTRQWESPQEAGLTDTVQLPLLRKFSVDCGHMSRVFSLPALECIHADFYNEWGRTSFAQFISGLPTSGLKGISLTTSETWIPRPSELVPFFEAAEDVQSLTFNTGHQRAEILLALLTFARHANADPKQYFTPFRKLQRLQLKIRVAHFSSVSKQDVIQTMGKVTEMLLRMVKTRSRRSELPCGIVLPLKSLRVEFSCRWKDFGLPKDLAEQIRAVGPPGMQLAVVQTNSSAW